jgi:hypothetical protein
MLGGTVPERESHREEPGLEAAPPPMLEETSAASSTRFSDSGHVPPVESLGARAELSASERAFGSSAPSRQNGLPSGEEGFKRMWDAHPHNYLPDDGSLGENIDSPQLLDDHGLPQNFANTCAIRLSIMLNSIGATITPAKAKAAGIARTPHYSKQTKQYYILSAAEMWTYLTKTFRPPDKTFPPRGRYKDADEYATAYESEIKPAIEGKRGIVAFDKIFTYGGTGHVDLFQGEQTSDAGDSFYQSQRVLLWYI